MIPFHGYPFPAAIMLYSTGVSAGLIAAQAIGLAMAVTVTYPDNSCTAARKTLIERELGYTRDIAKAAQADLQKGAYYQSFFAGSLRADPGFATGTEVSLITGPV